MTQAFTLRRHDRGWGRVTIAVTGEVDADTGDDLGAFILRTAGERGVTELIIDLDGVGFLDAAGVRTLLIGREAALRHGFAYQVTNPRGFVHSVLAVAGVLHILDVRTTIRTASDRSAVSGD